MNIALNNLKTTAAVSPRRAQAEPPVAAEAAGQAPRGRGRTAIRMPPSAADAQEPERGRGRTRERTAAQGQVPRQGGRPAAAPTPERLAAAEELPCVLPPALAARAHARRKIDPSVTLPPRTVAGPLEPAPTGAKLPIEVDRYLSELPDDAFVAHLSLRKKCAIIKEALMMDNALDYSSAALVLAASRRARQQERLLDREVRFAEVADALPMSDQEMVKTYKGGTCFSLAGHLMGHIKAKFNVPSFALISEQAPLQMAFWPSLLTADETVGIKDVKNHVGGIGHTDVLVPYLQGRDRRALVLPTGQMEGARYHDTDFEERMAMFGPERLLTNPHVLAFRSLWGRVRLHILKRVDQSVFGIDFLASKMFINRHAEDHLRILLRRQDAEDQTLIFDRVFNFAGLVRRDSPSKSEEAEADWQRCLQFLILVNRLFKFERGALDDIVHVIDRRQSYLEDLVHPWAIAMRDTAHERALALALTEDLALAQERHPKTAQRNGVPDRLHRVREHLRDAQDHVMAGRVDEANTTYLTARGAANAALATFTERRR